MNTAGHAAPVEADREYKIPCRSLVRQAAATARGEWRRGMVVAHSSRPGPLLPPGTTRLHLVARRRPRPLRSRAPGPLTGTDAPLPRRAPACRPPVSVVGRHPRVASRLLAPTSRRRRSTIPTIATPIRATGDAHTTRFMEDLLLLRRLGKNISTRSSRLGTDAPGEPTPLVVAGHTIAAVRRCRTGLSASCTPTLTPTIRKNSRGPD